MIGPQDGPKTTRLRYVIAKSCKDIEIYLNNLGTRVQIYGCPVYDGANWVLWYVPSDMGPDIPSIDLTKL